MADTNLYKILSGLYTGLNKLNVKSDRRDNEISGVIGANYPADKGTIQARLDTLETKAGVAPNALKILDKTYDTKADVTITSADIISQLSGALDVNAAGLALAKDVKAADDELDARLDTIEASYLTGVATNNTANNALTLTKNGHDVDGTVLVDGTTVVLNGKTIKSGIKLAKVENPSDSKLASQYQLVDVSGNPIAGDTIDIVKDQFLKTASYDSTKEELVFTFQVPSGELVTAVDVKDMVHEYQSGNGVFVGNTVNGKSVISAVIDSNSESFLTVGANGIKLAGVQTAINTAVETASNGLSGKLDALSGQVSGAFGSDAAAYVVTAAQNGITKSTYTMGSGALEATPSATKLATEKAVADADAALKAALSGAISGAYTDDEIVIGKGNGIKASGYKLGADTDKYTAESVIAAKTVMTEASFFNYVHSELSGLAADVDDLVEHKI